jgi:hypothetical protein
MTVLIYHPELSVSKRRRFNFSSFIPGFRLLRLTARGSPAYSAPSPAFLQSNAMMLPFALATTTGTEASLRDAGEQCWRDPWNEFHGYRQASLRDTKCLIWRAKGTRHAGGNPR